MKRKYRKRSSIKIKFVLTTAMILLLAMAAATYYSTETFFERSIKEIKLSMKRESAALESILENERKSIEEATSALSRNNGLLFGLELGMGYQMKESGPEYERENKVDKLVIFYKGELVYKTKNITTKNELDQYMKILEEIFHARTEDPYSYKVTGLVGAETVTVYSATPFVGQGGSIYGAILTGRDIVKLDKINNSNGIIAAMSKRLRSKVVLFKGDKLMGMSDEDGRVTAPELSESARVTVKNTYLQKEPYINGTIKFGGKNYYTGITKLVDRFGKRVGYISAAEDSSGIEKTINEIIINMVIMAGIAILIAIAFIVISSSLLLRPLSDMIRIMGEISNGDLSKRCVIKNKDEIGAAGEYFNETIDTIEIMVREIEQKNAKLLEMDKLKDDFLANTSHELRTPLNGIIGLSDSLIDGVSGTLPNKALSNLSMISASGKRLLNLVNDILDFSKMKRHDLVIDQRPVDIKQITDMVVMLCTPLVGNKNIIIENRIRDDFPYVLGDENRLEQIMYNLLGNAVKFTQSGEIVVSAMMLNGAAVIKVADTGIGIPEEKFATIFESFEQVDSSISREYGGTGLGLSITKQLVELHGGTIEVESEIDVGSVFKFTVPLSEAAGEIEQMEEAVIREQVAKEIKKAEHEVHAMNELTGKVKGIQGNIGGQKILIVDDEAVNLQVMIDHLTLNDLNVDIAMNGMEALDKISTIDYDLIVLDLMMPKMSGYDVCKKIREEYNMFELPIIILTAKNRVEDVVLAFDAGANDYINKPIEKKVFLARINTLLNLKNAVYDSIENEKSYEIEKQRRELTEKWSSELETANKALENSISELKMTQEQLILSEKMAALGGLVAGIAHEINTPVGIGVTAASHLREETEVIRRVYSSGQMKRSSLEDYLHTAEDSTKLILSNLQRASDLIRSFKQVSVDQSTEERRKFNVREYIEEILKSIHPTTRKTKHVIEVNCPEELEIDSYPGAFSQIITNFIMNSIIHAFDFKNEGLMKINVKLTEDNLEVIYSDDGKGVSDEQMGKIFEPFYTTKRGDGGTGLGLHIVYNLVTQRLKGSIECKSKPGEGIQFAIKIPKANI